MELIFARIKLRDFSEFWSISQKLGPAKIIRKLLIRKICKFLNRGNQVSGYLYTLCTKYGYMQNEILWNIWSRFLREK